ncbi:hypothetical protein B0H19DRAFT_1059824 [Mycena capillaripes]|nr:hypothetical protein B0H19DRAFT_1059824 [Mycena capillaripes]
MADGSDSLVARQWPEYSLSANTPYTKKLASHRLQQYAGNSQEVGDVITGDPILPPKLEREIFELGAAVIPNFDRALNIRAHLAPAVRVLSVCTGIISLGCNYRYSSIAPLLTPLPLKRLLVSELDIPSASIDLPPWTAFLTHLGLSYTLPQDPSTAFAALPALTYLAVGHRALGHGFDQRAFGEVGHGPRAQWPLQRGPTPLLSRGCDEARRGELSRDLHSDRFVDRRLKTRGTWERWSRFLPDMFGTAEGQFSGRKRCMHLCQVSA